jgi:hypothetical protein
VALPLGLAFTVLDIPVLYHLRLDHPSLRWIWTAPRGFPTHGAGPLLGTKPPLGHPKVMLPVPISNQDYLTPGALPPGPFPRIGAWP